MTSRRVAWILALTALAATLWSINEPGLTVDEPINVGHGKAWTASLRRLGWDFFRAENVYRLWGTAHEHPPLSRGLIGLTHALFDPLPNDPQAFQPKAGRPISALAFAWIVYLATRLAWRGAGPAAGWTAGGVAMLTPRLFGHAHLASPEVVSAACFLGSLYAAAELFSIEVMSQGKGRLAARAVAAGLLLGLALLAKLTSVLLPTAVAAAAIATWRCKALMPLSVWGMTGAAVFVAGWPWLWPFDFPDYWPGWMETLQRIKEFAFVGVDRPTVYVWYFGRQAPSASEWVPWHFVWVFFFATMPLGMTGLGLLGLAEAWRRRALFSVRLITTTLALILCFFSLPIDKYDGERLFLTAFPLWAILAGFGGRRMIDALSRWKPAPAAVLFCLVVGQAYGVYKYHPYELSYYSPVVGGLAGADRLGLEATYWGDSLSEDVLDRLSARMPPGGAAALFPTLYSGHAVRLTSPGLRARRQAIVPGDLLEKEKFDWAILFNRRGYLIDPLPSMIQKDWQWVDEEARDGVWLTRIYRRPRSDAPNAPAQDSPNRSEASPSREGNARRASRS